jgi:hypothetical protein
MAEMVISRTLRRIITVAAPMPPLPTPLIAEQLTFMMKSSTFHSSAPETPPCPTPSSNRALETYIVTVVISVFAVVMLAAFMAYLRRRRKMNRSRLGHED